MMVKKDTQVFVVVPTTLMGDTKYGVTHKDHTDDILLIYNDKHLAEDMCQVFNAVYELGYGMGIEQYIQTAVLLHTVVGGLCACREFIEGYKAFTPTLATDLLEKIDAVVAMYHACPVPVSAAEVAQVMMYMVKTAREMKKEG